MTIEEIEDWWKDHPDVPSMCGYWEEVTTWLIERVKDLELTRNKAERCCCVFEEDGETILRWCDAHAIWRDRAKELEIYTQQLRGALGYEVPGNIRENPEIHNGIAEALQQRVESLEANLAREITYKETAEALERDLKFNAHLLAKQCDIAREAETRVMELTGQNELLQKDNRVLDGLFMKYHARVGELEADLALNASMLAKQTDLAREAESKEYGCKKVIQVFNKISPRLETRIRKLEADLTIKMLENAKGAQVLAQVEAERTELVNGIREYLDDPEFDTDILRRLVEGKPCAGMKKC